MSEKLKAMFAAHKPGPEKVKKLWPYIFLCMLPTLVFLGYVKFLMGLKGPAMGAAGMLVIPLLPAVYLTGVSGLLLTGLEWRQYRLRIKRGEQAGLRYYVLASLLNFPFLGLFGYWMFKL